MRHFLTKSYEGPRVVARQWKQCCLPPETLLCRGSQNIAVDFMYGYHCPPHGLLLQRDA